MTTVTYFHEDYRQALEMHGALIEKAKIDREAFQKGEQVLILLGEGSLSYSSDIFRETAIQSGDIVTLMSTNRPGRVSAKAKVLSLTKDEINNGVASPHLAQQYLRPYVIIASFAFAKKMAEADGETFCYNDIEIELSRNASYVSTTKRLATLFAENGFKYSSGWEDRNIAWETFIRRVCVYGTLLCVILSAYLLLQMNLQRMRNFEQSNRYVILKRLGMSDSFYIGMTVKSGIKDALWLLPGIPLSYGMAFLMEWVDVKNNITASTWSSWIGDYTQDTFEIVMGRMIDNTGMGYVMVFVLLLSIAFVGIRYLAARRLVF